MAKRGRPAQPKKLNEQKQEVINQNHLEENPEGHPVAEAAPLVIAKEIPPMERIVFINGRDPGCPHEFHYHSKTHYLKHYKLLHGFEYELPVEVIEHLENRRIPNYSYRKGQDGHPEMYISSFNYLYQCRRARSPQSLSRAA